MSVQALGNKQQEALPMGVPEIDGFLVVSQTIVDIAEISLSELSDASLPRDLSHTEVEVSDHEISLSESEEEPAKDWLDAQMDSESERVEVQQVEFDEPSSDDEIGSMVLTRPVSRAKREIVEDEVADRAAFKEERSLAFQKRRKRINRLKEKELIIRREILLERRNITILEREMQEVEDSLVAAVDDQQDEQSSCGIIDRITGFACDVFKNGYQMFQLGANLLSNRRMFA